MINTNVSLLNTAICAQIPKYDAFDLKMYNWKILMTLRMYLGNLYNFITISRDLFLIRLRAAFKNDKSMRFPTDGKESEHNKHSNHIKDE